MNKYEAMIIFSESLKDNVLEEAVGRVRDEIKKHGGETENTTRLGKRAFARRMRKQDGGHYFILNFSMPGDQITPLLARFKLDEEMFRIQIVRAPERVPEAKKPKESRRHGEP